MSRSQPENTPQTKINQAITGLVQARNKGDQSAIIENLTAISVLLPLLPPASASEIVARISQAVENQPESSHN